jgi:hypothetical protein
LTRSDKSLFFFDSWEKKTRVLADRSQGSDRAIMSAHLDLTCCRLDYLA